MLPLTTESTTARRLHIGGKVRKEGWEVLNALPGSYVDHLGNAKDLSAFEDHLFQEIYASHILEHLDYQLDLTLALREWHRVLCPGGTLYISVPDLDILCKLLLCKEPLSFDERFEVMRMIFGGHMDDYDYHLVGLNKEFLFQYLRAQGFVDIQQVDNFGLFEDLSSKLFKNVPISLNVIAKKAQSSSPCSE